MSFVEAAQPVASIEDSAYTPSSDDREQALHQDASFLCEGFSFSSWQARVQPRCERDRVEAGAQLEKCVS